MATVTRSYATPVVMAQPGAGAASSAAASASDMEGRGFAEAATSNPPPSRDGAPPGGQQAGSSAPATAAGGGATLHNDGTRMSVPAIARVPGRGTAFLVSQGLLMTSARVVPDREKAGRLHAIFFEGSKRPTVEVALRPDIFFFASAFPPHVDYVLVACDTAGVHNVQPIRIPMVRQERPEVRERDHLMVFQHPIPIAQDSSQRPTASAGGDALRQAMAGGGGGGAGAGAAAGAAALPPPGQVVIHTSRVRLRKEDVLHLDVHGSYVTAGCPAFNSSATLVGIQQQSFSNEPSSTVLSIATITDHLFGNGMLGRIQAKPKFEDLWATWVIPGDTNRMVTLLQNFRQRDLSKLASMRLFVHVAEAAAANTRGVLEALRSCGGIRVMLNSIAQHLSECDPVFIAAGLRALWFVSLASDAARALVRELGGPAIVLQCLRRFMSDAEDVAQFAIVVLYNVTQPDDGAGDVGSSPLHTADPNGSSAQRSVQTERDGTGGADGDPSVQGLLATPGFAMEAVRCAFCAAESFPNAEVLQKFAVALWINLVSPEAEAQAAMASYSPDGEPPADGFGDVLQGPSMRKRASAEPSAAASARQIGAGALQSRSGSGRIPVPPSVGPEPFGRGGHRADGSNRVSISSEAQGSQAPVPSVGGGAPPPSSSPRHSGAAAHSAAAAAIAVRASHETLGSAAALAALPRQGSVGALTDVNGAVAPVATTSQGQPSSPLGASNGNGMVVPLTWEVVFSGIIEHVATKVLSRFAHREHVVELAATLIAVVARQAPMQRAKALGLAVGPLIDAIQRFPSVTAIQREANNALWAIGNDATQRAEIFRHPAGMEALRTSGAVMSM